MNKNEAQRREIARRVIERYCDDVIVDRVPLDEGGLSRILRQAQSSSFAVLTAFREEYDLKTNRARNKKLVAALNSAKLGAHRVIGYWDETLAPGAVRQGAAEPGDDPLVEESLFVPKPPSMTDDQFIDFLFRAGRKHKQTAIIFGRGAKWHDLPGERGGKPGEIFLLYPEDRSREKIGTGVSLNKVARAYSRARNKSDIPFVFESALRPTNIAGRVGWERNGLLWLRD